MTVGPHNDQRTRISLFRESQILQGKCIRRLNNISSAVFVELYYVKILELPFFSFINVEKFLHYIIIIIFKTALTVLRGPLAYPNGLLD